MGVSSTKVRERTTHAVVRGGWCGGGAKKCWKESVGAARRGDVGSAP